MCDRCWRKGQKLTEDKTAQQKMTAVARTDGDKLNAYFAAQEEWTKTNPFVPPTAGEEERRAFQRKYAKMLTGWVEKLPKEQFLAQQRLEAWGEVPEVSDADVVAEGKRALRLEGRSADGLRTVSDGAGRGPCVGETGSGVGCSAGADRGGAGGGGEAGSTGCGVRRSDLYTAPSDVLRKETNLWFRNAEIWETLTTAYSNGANRSCCAADAGDVGKRIGGASGRRAGDRFRAAREKEAQVRTLPARLLTSRGCWRTVY